MFRPGRLLHRALSQESRVVVYALEMPVGVVVLVVASAFMHALWNALLKRAHDPEHAVSSILAVSAATSVVIVLAMQVPVPPWKSVACCVGAGILEAGYFVTLARALSRAPLGPVYTTVRGGGLFIVWPASIVLLGEPLRLTAAGGTLLVVLGLVATGAADGIRKAASPGRLGWAMICALFVGSYHVLYKVALATGSSPAFVNASLVIAALFTLARLDRARWRCALAAARAEPVRIVVAGVLGSAGFVLFLTAMQSAGAGAAVTLRNTSILFAQLLGLPHGERPKPLGIVGMLLVTSGAILLAYHG